MSIRKLSFLVLFFTSLSSSLLIPVAGQTSCLEYSDNFTTLNTDYWRDTSQSISGDTGTANYETDDGNLTISITDATTGHSTHFQSKQTYVGSFNASVYITEAEYTTDPDHYSDMVLSYTQSNIESDKESFSLRFQVLDGTTKVDFVKVHDSVHTVLGSTAYDGSLPLKLSLVSDGETLIAKYNDTTLVTTAVPTEFTSPWLSIHGFTYTKDVAKPSSLTFSFDDYNVTCSTLSVLPSTALSTKQVSIVFALMLIGLAPLVYFSILEVQKYFKKENEMREKGFVENLVRL